MTVEQKVAEASEKLAKADPKREAKGKFRKETWREKYGFWRIMWIFMLGVCAGSPLALAYVAMHDTSFFESRTIIITNVAEAATVEAPQVKEMSVPVEVSVETIADTIWSNESSRGVNNYSKCAAVGKVNEIGYGIDGSGKYQCFKNHEEEMTVLAGWVVDHRAQGMSDTELMCHYSGANYKICK